MAKNIIMQVLTENGYEPMYPFSPRQIMNATFLPTSTASQYNITITGLPTPLTNNFGNDMGIISFIPTVNNANNLKLSLNGESAKPVLFLNGSAVKANTFGIGKNVLLRFYNGNFYVLIDKQQIGLENVDNTSDLDKPISRAMQTALDKKLNTPVAIPDGSNLNSYTTAGLYYVQTTVSARTMQNLPQGFDQAFSLFVEVHAGVKQTLTSYGTNGIRTWVRNSYSGSWSQWYQQAFILTGTSDPSSSLGADGNIYIKYSN